MRSRRPWLMQSSTESPRVRYPCDRRSDAGLLAHAATTPVRTKAHGYTFNGKSFPATQPLVAKLGQKVRIRFMNEGMMIHPMHLHGMHMTVIAKDGWPVPAAWKCDTL